MAEYGYDLPIEGMSSFDLVHDIALRIASTRDAEILRVLEERYGFVNPIRCRDCKFFDTRKCKSQWPFNLDGFCAWGERKVVEPTTNDVDTEVKE